MTEVDDLRSEVAALRRQVQDTMHLAELAATINMIFNRALVEIMTKRMTRAEIIEELRAVPLRGIGGRPDLEAMAHNIIAQLIAGIDQRSVMPAGHA